VNQLVIVIGKTVDEKYYFRVRIDNGRILLTSREYRHIESCLNAIYEIQQYSDCECVEERATDNGHQYTLTGAWGKMIGESPVYQRAHEMKKDMDIVKKMIGRAEVIDNSALIRFFRPIRIK
jgi:uncharacterized protein YegP (UPF0339 family)